MDSTLIETEVIDELAVRAGVGDEVKAITESAMRGEIDFCESFARRVGLLKGLDESVLKEVAESLPVTEGVDRLMQVLKRAGFKIAILSGGFTYFGNYLKQRYGIDYVYANELEIIDGKLTGRYVGDIVDVDPAPVIDVLQQGYIPVVSTVAQGIDDETNYNINADTAASKLAVALGAKKLILLTDVRGLMLDVNDENSVLHRLKVSEVPKLVRDGVIKGGMIPKVDCCVEAVRKGVERATILDGRVKHSILIELLSKVGAGTMFQ